MKGFSAQLEIENADEAERVCQALPVNGNVIMPFRPAFRAHRSGRLTDQFGVPRRAVDD